jgi:hypothetical protein
VTPIAALERHELWPLLERGPKDPDQQPALARIAPPAGVMGLKEPGGAVSFYPFEREKRPRRAMQLLKVGRTLSATALPGSFGDGCA